MTSMKNSRQESELRCKKGTAKRVKRYYNSYLLVNSDKYKKETRLVGQKVND